MKRHADSPTFRRRSLEYTPAQLARQSAIGVELRALARDRHPERYAADGTALIGYAGASWGERLASYVASKQVRA
jgi:hypothetical protein